MSAWQEYKKKLGTTRPGMWLNKPRVMRQKRNRKIGGLFAKNAHDYLKSPANVKNVVVL